MKKLMIAAAAAAMIGGAFADDAITIKYNQVGTNEALQVCQVLQYKIKASTEKSINLDGDKKKFGKTLKDTTLAVDGVYYYVGNGKWYHFAWNTKEVLVDKEESAPAFDIFENNDKNKALAVFVGTWTDGKLNEKTGKWEQFADGHAEADTYGALKYVKDPADKKAKILDRTVKSIKYVDGSVKCTIKTFKAGKKTVEEQIAAYIAKITKKAPAKK